MIGKSIFFLVRNRNLLTVLLLLTTLAVLALTMLPSNKLGNSPLYEYDKVGHFGLFLYGRSSSASLISPGKISTAA
jgi:hypothetical protein